jgi:hypothetical protein
VFAPPEVAVGESAAVAVVAEDLVARVLVTGGEPDGQAILHAEEKIGLAGIGHGLDVQFDPAKRTVVGGGERAFELRDPDEVAALEPQFLAQE